MFTEGGAGSPQSGEISLATENIGLSKYFGVLGQSSTEGDYGFSAQGDKGSKCLARYVAFNIHVYDDAGVSSSDELKIEVSVQKEMTAKELEFTSLPNPPKPSYRGDPKEKFESDLSTGARYIIASVMTLLASTLIYF